MPRRIRFEIIGPIIDIEVIAAGPGVRIVSQLRKAYGSGRWRKLKGFTKVRLKNGAVWNVELHWYEAHGIGKVDFKIKHFLNKEA